MPAPLAAGDLPIRTSAEDLLTLRITPRSGTDGVVGERQGVVLIRLRAAAVDGEANAALIGFLAERCAVARSQVRLMQGLRGRLKRVRVAGLSAGELRRKLLEGAPGSPP